VVAYAGRQFLAVGGPGIDQLAGAAVATVDEGAVTGYYRGILEGSGWQVTAGSPPEVVAQ
jgi:hypothetical protein